MSGPPRAMEEEEEEPEDGNFGVNVDADHGREYGPP